MAFLTELGESNEKNSITQFSDEWLRERGNSPIRQVPSTKFVLSRWFFDLRSAIVPKARTTAKRTQMFAAAEYPRRLKKPAYTSQVVKKT